MGLQIFWRANLGGRLAGPSCLLLVSRASKHAMHCEKWPIYLIGKSYANNLFLTHFPLNQFILNKQMGLGGPIG